MACEDTLIEGCGEIRFIYNFALSVALYSGVGHLLEGGSGGGRPFISCCAVLVT